MFYICVRRNTEEDPLEAFMREISDLIAEPATEKKGEVLEDEDFSEDFCPVKPNLEPVLQRKTQIAPLAAVDHSKIQYGALLKVKNT